MTGGSRSGAGSRFRREWLSFRNAAAGIADVCRSERHMRFHLLATVLAGIAGWRLGVSRTDWLWLLAAVSTVWIAETVNSAVERMVDLVSPEFHPLAGAAKDMAAGAVLIAALFAAVVGIVVLGPGLWQAVWG